VPHLARPIPKGIDTQLLVPPRRHLRLASAPKILLYSHDTFGLGNIRRTLLISETLQEEYPEAAVLIVTGSPVIHAFRIPDGIDYVKLPCLDRIQADRYRPKFLAEWSAEIANIRRAILAKAVLGFAPDLMIVDKRAAGVDGELVETLRALRRSRRPVKLVLGIRDILDEPAKTRNSLRETRCLEIVQQYYDEVWIYGERSIFDAVREYGFPETVARKTRYCGYLKRPTQVFDRPAGPPHVLVTTGGGGDGSDLIRTYLEGLLTLPRSIALRTTIVFGPEMPTANRVEFRERFGSMTDVVFVDFEADLTRLYAESDLVVSMAGYNTVCELLSFGRRAILVPRAAPVAEQLLRARLFAARGDFDMVEPEELRPQVLIEKVLTAIAGAPKQANTVDLDGLPRIRARLRQLLEGSRQ
jgi:predicted glycosyltransferase